MISTPLPPGVQKHHVVYLEEIHCPLPKLDFEHDVTCHYTTDPAQVADRIRTATIVIGTVCPVTRADMETAPHLQLIAVLATGIGWVDKPYCAERGITVVNCPQSNVEALGEHFLALYFSSRRRVPEMHYRTTRTREWPEKGSLISYWQQGPPLSCGKEILGIIGYGHLGKRFEGLAKATGFGKIILSERKGVQEARHGRVTFDELIRNATTIAVCCPSEPDTIDLISDAEINMMRKEMLIINMARGGIVNEEALARALKSGRIFGAATDVMLVEPAELGKSPLLPDVTKGEDPLPNLIVTPHIAWYAEQTIENLLELCKDGVECFVHGRLYDGDRAVKCVAVHDGKIWK